MRSRFSRAGPAAGLVLATPLALVLAGGCSVEVRAEDQVRVQKEERESLRALLMRLYTTGREHEDALEKLVAFAEPEAFQTLLDAAVERATPRRVGLLLEHVGLFAIGPAAHEPYVREALEAVARDRTRGVEARYVARLALGELDAPSLPRQPPWHTGLAAVVDMRGPRKVYARDGLEEHAEPPPFFGPLPDPSWRTFLIEAHRAGIAVIVSAGGAELRDPPPAGVMTAVAPGGARIRALREGEPAWTLDAVPPAELRERPECFGHTATAPERALRALAALNGLAVVRTGATTFEARGP